jgi:DNA polymerase-1
MEYLTWSHRCQLLPDHHGEHMHPSGKRHWDEEKVQRILDEARRRNLPVIESTSAAAKDKPALDALTNKVWCVSLAGPGRTDVIPCGHPARRPQLQPADVFDALAPLFFSDRRKIGHNVGFDLLSAAKYWGGMPPPPYGDTMTLVFLINENLGRYNLGALSSYYLGYDYVEKLGEEAYRVEWKRATRYSMLDARNAWLLWQKFSPLLQAPMRQKLARLFDLEMDVMRVLMDMRSTGAYVDKEGFRRLRPILEEQKRILKGEIDEMVGHPINLNSTQQLAKWLYHELGLRCTVFTETGMESTGAEALQRLRHKAPRLVLAHKEVSKLLSVYVAGFMPHIDDDNRIRASLNQAVAKTGRLSCSQPNLQNIPARYRENTEGTMIRRLFVAPSGKVLIVADYSQIELRILAHQTKDRRLLYAYKEEIDLHVQTASLIWKIPPDKVTAEQRAIAKNSNFNFAFEGGATRVVAMSGIPLREAEHVYDAWHEAYPGVKKWAKYIKRYCWDHGYVETLYGRKRRLKDITSPDNKKRSYAERQAVNHPVQGTAADIAKLALVRVWEALKDYDARLVLQIHDEFVIECDKRQVDEVLPLVKVAMEDIRRGDRLVLDVPLEVNIGIGKNWAEAK